MGLPLLDVHIVVVVVVVVVVVIVVITFLVVVVVVAVVVVAAAAAVVVVGFLVTHLRRCRYRYQMNFDKRNNSPTYKLTIHRGGQLVSMKRARPRWCSRRAKWRPKPLCPLASQEP